MIWNLFLHIIAGIVGRHIFTLKASGILWCLLIAAIVQGIDMIRVFKSHKKRIERASPQLREEQMRNFRKRAPVIMPQIYVGKVLLYGAITLIVSAIAR